jgi:hypothetical protein
VRMMIAPETRTANRNSARCLSSMARASRSLFPERSSVAIRSSARIEALALKREAVGSTPTFLINSRCRAVVPYTLILRTGLAIDFVAKAFRQRWWIVKPAYWIALVARHARATAIAFTPRSIGVCLAHPSGAAALRARAAGRVSPLGRCGASRVRPAAT